MLSISEFILPARPFRAAHSAARREFRSSYFKNTPPIGIFQTRKLHLPPPPRPRAGGGEERIPFELFQEYPANWNFASEKAHPRGAFRAARLGFERAFWAKKKRIYQSKYGSSRFVLEMLSFPIYPQTKVISPLDLRI